MTGKILVGNGIATQKNSWSFEGETAKYFDDHVRQSIPGYDHGHELILSLSDFFVLPDSVCYDLGSSTGALINKLVNRHYSSKPGIRWIGIDSVKEMINEAESKKSPIDSIEFINADARDVELLNSDFIISYYFVQFVPPRDRQTLINKIYNSLNWGGAFVWFEKVRVPDARFQDILNNLYTNFKLQQGFTPQEIINKSESLKSVLEPFSHQGNLDLLKRAGFKDIMPVFRDICFEGLICIK